MGTFQALNGLGKSLLSCQSCTEKKLVFLDTLLNFQTGHLTCLTFLSPVDVILRQLSIGGHLKISLERYFWTITSVLQVVVTKSFAATVNNSGFFN